LLFTELDHPFENPPVMVEKEIFGLELLDGGIQRVVVEQDGAKDAALGIKIVWQGSFKGDFGWHWIRFYFAFILSLQAGRSNSFFYPADFLPSRRRAHALKSEGLHSEPCNHGRQPDALWTASEKWKSPPEVALEGSG
jgi:hypothetical protein